MKILLLNPLLDAEHNLVRALNRHGYSVLFAIDPQQALQMLRFHGNSVDLAVIHREDVRGQNSPGLELVTALHADPVFNKIPIILTTAGWSDAECVEHQQSSLGAHAYLGFPCSESVMVETIAQVSGQMLPRSVVEHADSLDLPDITRTAPPPSSPEMSKPMAGDTRMPELATSDILVNPPQSGGTTRVMPPQGLPLGPPVQEQELVLEDAAVLFDTPDHHAINKIKLEAPELPPEEREAQRIAEGGEPGEEPTRVRSEIESFVSDIPGDEELNNLIASAQGKVKQKQADPMFATPEEVMAREMPYLADDAKVEDGAETEEQDDPSEEIDYGPRDEHGQPLGDAVVPGGAAVSPDLETLKKYLLLREQDVAALSTQLKAARTQAAKMEESLRKEKHRANDAVHKLEENNKRIAEFEREKEIALEGITAELAEIKFTAKAKSDKVKILESHVREAADEMIKLKDRVRADIRKIRAREKELENRLEIIKKDSEVLIGARENKIIDLKRKLDLVEFNLDLLQDQYSREKEVSSSLREKLNRAQQAVRVAGGLLDNDDSEVKSESPSVDKKTPKARAAS